MREERFYFPTQLRVLLGGSGQIDQDPSHQARMSRIAGRDHARSTARYTDKITSTDNRGKSVGEGHGRRCALRRSADQALTDAEQARLFEVAKTIPPGS